MGMNSPPYLPTFGAGAPGVNVPKNMPYYNVSTNPYTAYVYRSGAWHIVGAAAGSNATQLQGRDIDAAAPNNNDVLTWIAANADWEPAPSGGGGGEPSITKFTTALLPGFDPQFIGQPGNVALTNLNKTATPVGGRWQPLSGTPAKFTGKKYFEINSASTFQIAIGLCGSNGHTKDQNNNYLGSTGNIYGQIGWRSDGSVHTNGGPSIGDIDIANIQIWGAGDTCCIAIDLDAMLVWFRTNTGNWNNSVLADPATGIGGIDASWLLYMASNYLVWPAITNGGNLASNLYLLAADFLQGIPVGFSAWAP